MFKIKQKTLKKILTILKPGTNKAISIQTGCVNFKKTIMTTESPFFSVSYPIESGITGSYQLTDFLKIVGQIKATTEIHLKQTPKNLQIVATEGSKNLRFALKGQWETPISSLFNQESKDWKVIPSGFNAGLADILPIAKKSTTPTNHLHCVHITPTHFAATDGCRVVMRAVKAHLSKPVILPATSIKELLKINPEYYAQEGPHLFFRNKDGVIYSLSEFLDEFPAIAHLFKIKLGPNIETGESFREIVQIADSMDAQRIELHFKESGKAPIAGEVTLQAITKSGPFRGTAPIEYKGSDFKIKIRPEYILDGLQYSNTFAFSEGKQYLAVFTPNTRYVAGILLE